MHSVTCTPKDATTPPAPPPDSAAPTLQLLTYRHRTLPHAHSNCVAAARHQPGTGAVLAAAFLASPKARTRGSLANLHERVP